MNSINEYHDFGTIAGSYTAMAATSMNRKVDEDEIKEDFRPLNTGINSDVEKGLQLLKDNGFRLAINYLPSCAKAAVNQFKFNRLF
jgi:2-haloacid dehalogenase